MYSLKFTVEVPVPILIRRPWWKFWGHDQIGQSTSWRVVALDGLSQYQADHIIHMYGNTELAELLVAVVNRGTDRMADLKLFTDGDVPYAPIKIVEEEEEPPQPFKPWRPNIREHQG